MQELDISFLPRPVPNEEIRFKSNRHGVSFSGYINVVRFVDKDTKQYVVYAPSLEISGYGDTVEEAHKILDFNLKELLLHLQHLPKHEAKKTLADLGWVQHRLFNRQFSKAYIDDDGKLKNLNAENDKVEFLSLTAA